MIELTRLNGHKIVVNSDLIRYAESSPDTILTLVTGEKLLVTEATAEIARLTQQYRAEVLRYAWPSAATALGTQANFLASKIATSAQTE